MDEMDGPTLDRWLAETVMGWQLAGDSWVDASGAYQISAEQNGSDCAVCNVWQPSKLEGQAIQAAEKALEDGRILGWSMQSHDWRNVSITRLSVEVVSQGERRGIAPPLPLLICRTLYAAIAVPRPP